MQNNKAGSTNIKNLFANAINKKALRQALSDPKSAKEIKRIIKKVRY